MKYKVGDLIICLVEIQKSGRKSIVNLLEVLFDSEERNKDSEFQEIAFQIIGKNETFETYKIVLPDDIVGWSISDFHIEQENVAKAFRGRKFYDVSEQLVLRKKA